MTLKVYDDFDEYVGDIFDQSDPWEVIEAALPGNYIVEQEDDVFSLIKVQDRSCYTERRADGEVCDEKSFITIVAKDILRGRYGHRFE